MGPTVHSSSTSAAPDRIVDFTDGSDLISLGFLPTAVLTGAVQSGAAAAATVAARPGAPAPRPPCSSDASMAAAKAAERKKAREKLEEMDAGEGVCLNCGS
jgi:hypothetical protein